MSAWPPITFSNDSATNIESDLQHLVHQIETCQVLEGMSKQALLAFPVIVMAVYKVQTNETWVNLLASNQRPEVRSIVRYQDPILDDGSLDMLPVLCAMPSEPPDMSTVHPCIACDLGKVGTQTLVDQELH